MKDTLKELQELLKGREYVFLNDDLVDIDDVVDEINLIQENNMGENNFLELLIYDSKKVNKPAFTFEDLGEMLDNSDYITNNYYNTDLLEKNEEVLKKINELFHSILLSIYQIGNKICSITIYADGYKEMELLKESK